MNTGELFSLTFDADKHVIRVGGELSFATVNAVLSQTKNVFESVTDLNIDLAAVTRSDSAGVALLIDWMRIAKDASRKIVFHNIPAQMLAIASASGLDELLPLQ
jgi:phospholipid transport system transporter-binding protein